jgi:hypothetical protein
MLLYEPALSESLVITSRRVLNLLMEEALQICRVDANILNKQILDTDKFCWSRLTNKKLINSAVTEAKSKILLLDTF